VAKAGKLTLRTVPPEDKQGEFESRRCVCGFRPEALCLW
jgi:hypothetical protein